MAKYLKGLDTLRAIAALIVVLEHFEQLKKDAAIVNLIDKNYYLPSGHISVMLFFVISGFLITYLLVKERESTGRISFRNFYMRRIFRIWPLYYLILILSFLIFRVDYSKETIILCFTIFPNIAYTLHAGWPTSPQVWSLGVEEQFYLFWPLILTLIPNKKVPLYLILFFIGYSILPILIGFVNIRMIHNNELEEFVARFFYLSKFNCMGIGCLIGYLYASNDKRLEYINNKYIAYVSIALAIILWFLGFGMKYFTEEFYSVLFAIALYNIVANPQINIDTRISSYIGKISYGIYMYHYIILSLVIKYLPVIENTFIYIMALYILGFGGTLLVSWLSFESIEKYFLSMKKKYEAK